MTYSFADGDPRQRIDRRELEVKCKKDIYRSLQKRLILAHESAARVVVQSIIQERGIQFNIDDFFEKVKKTDFLNTAAGEEMVLEVGKEEVEELALVESVYMELSRRMQGADLIKEHEEIQEYAGDRAQIEADMIVTMHEKNRANALDKFGFIKSPDHYQLLYQLELKRLKLLPQPEKREKFPEDDEFCMVVMEIDLDNFKSENDIAGDHVLVDDKVIQPLFHSLSKALRTEDVVCRMGGDEITLIANGVRVSAVSAIVKRVDEAIRAIKRVSDPGAPLTGSIGYYVIEQSKTEGAPQALEARQHADHAASIAKRTQRGTVQEWSPDLQEVPKDVAYFRRQLEAAFLRVYEGDVQFMNDILKLAAERMANQYNQSQ
ncbi:MAG: GGDEF domain-containing protein [Patescibacteria group bacterium]